MFLERERERNSAGVRARLLHSFTARDIKMVYLGVHLCPSLSLSYFCVRSTASMFQHFLYRKFQCCLMTKQIWIGEISKGMFWSLSQLCNHWKFSKWRSSGLLGQQWIWSGQRLGGFTPRRTCPKGWQVRFPYQPDNLRNTEKPYFKNWGEKIYIVARDPMLLRPPLFKFAIVESWIAFACIVALNMNIRYLIFATWWLSVGWQGSFTFHAVPHTLVAPTYLPATLCWARQVMMMYNIFCIMWLTIRFVLQYWPS